jgi:hypothetical protein
VHWPNRFIRLKLHKLDSAGRWWMLRIPQRATRDTELSISAYFANGDEAAELGIKQAVK